MQAVRAHPEVILGRTPGDRLQPVLERESNVAIEVPQVNLDRSEQREQGIFPQYAEHAAVVGFLDSFDVGLRLGRKHVEWNWRGRAPGPLSNPRVVVLVARNRGRGIVPVTNIPTTAGGNPDRRRSS